MTRLSHMAVLLAVSLIVAICGYHALAATTEVHIVLYAEDGYTIINQTTVDYRWMEQHLPVMGDGKTHYYHQGPVFVDNPDDRWNPGEDTNVLEKDMGAVKGTELRSLCDLVGGMEPGDTVTIKASDGFTKVFPYENVYEPPARQGPMVITWYHANQSYVPGYADGMKLVFFADSSTNPWGVRAFGVWDWHESAAEEYWYFYYQGQEKYPTTTGLGVKYVSEIDIWSTRQPEGSMAVVSTPPGARVYLDDTDAGLVTPCTLTGLDVGYYTVSVQKAGYVQPEEQQVEVTSGKEARVSFNLEPIPQADGGTSSGDSGGAELYAGIDPEVLSGTQLARIEPMTINGSVIVIPSITLPFILKGGEERPLAFDPTAFPDAAPSFVWLYLFLDNSTADPGSSPEPQIRVLKGEKQVQPSRVYHERSDEKDPPLASTLVYLFPDMDKTGTILLTSLGPQSGKSRVAGALLIYGYEDLPGTITRVMISEGADLVVESPDQGLPAGQADFGNVSAPFNGTVYFVSTPGTAAGNLTFFINGVSTPGRLVPRSGSLTLYVIPVPELPGTAGVRLETVSSGLPVVHRLALLEAGGHVGAGVDPGVPENVTITSTITMHATPTIPAATGTGTMLEISPSPAEQGSEPPDLIGNFLCWVLNFLLKLEGRPAEGCLVNSPVVGSEKSSVRSVQDTPEPEPAHYILAITSAPSSAAVFVDDQDTGNVTPCTIMLDDGASHQIRLTKEGYLPFEHQVSYPDDTIDAILEPAPLPEPEPTGSATAQSGSHYGGLSLKSYPRQAEIKVDGVFMSGETPVMVYPIREGFHTIFAGVPDSGGGYVSRETDRVWVFPDALMPVAINLMDAPQVVSVNVTSGARVGERFTAEGYFPVKRIPERVEFGGIPPFITLTNGSAFISFSIPGSERDNGVFVIPDTDPPVCNLTVESKPAGAEVFLDGIRTGLTAPVTISNVSAGYHRVSLSLAGYLPVSDLIQISEEECEEESFTVRYPMEAYPCGTLHIQSDPTGAAVSFRGLKTGEITPCTLDYIPIGIWEVTLTHGKRKKSVDTTVEPGSNRTYLVEFD